MSGKAIIGSTLIDRLSTGIVDRMRGLQDRLGLSQCQLWRVQRRWSGSRRGEGNPTFVLNERIGPGNPMVVIPNTQEGLHTELEPGSALEEGVILVSEVSLTYAHADLVGPVPLPSTDEWYYRLIDTSGQLSPPRFFIVDAPPFPDRQKTLGWTMRLRRARITEDR